MGAYNWDFLIVFQNLDVLAKGLLLTFKIAASSLVTGLIIGLVLGGMRLSKKKLLSFPAAVFVEIFRNTPALVQIMWFFYALPILLNLQVSPFMAAFLSLTMNNAAFSAEIYKAGINSIEKGQWEAGKALGMNFLKLMQRVILPQAIKRTIPAFTNRSVELTRMTSLASTIAYGELMYQGRLLSEYLYRPIEIFTTVALIYFIILYTGTIFSGLLEKRLSRSD